MYISGPPVTPTTAGPELYVRAALRREFELPPLIASRPEHEPHLRGYLSDMLTPYGLPLGDDLAGHSYGEMGAALVAELVPAELPVDLLVVAFAVHDVRPGRSVATYLSHLCPGRPLAFAICDQGAAAAFTGLRLVREYARAGARRALLLVLEQAGLPYDAGTELPAAHTGVALLVEAGDPGGSGTVVRSVRQHAGVSADGVAGLLADELAAAAPCTPIVTPGLLAADPLVDARVPATGRLHTGVWWELAGALAHPGRLVLAAHDRPLGYLCTTTIDVTADANHQGTGVHRQLARP